MTAEAAAKHGVGEEDCNRFRFFVNIFQLYEIYYLEQRTNK